MAGKIVVGVDGSEGSLRALRWAAEEARLRDAVLEAVAVWHVPVLSTIPAFGVMPSADEMTEQARAGLIELLQDEGITSGDGLTVLETVAQGSAAGVLVDLAADADLLVVGSRGHGGFSGLLLGSVSQATVTHSRCPVVIVPPAERET
jgi:nucleotide-binding universal stress UspA family protein